jgi:hypothetical protein
MATRPAIRVACLSGHVSDHRAATLDRMPDFVPYRKVSYGVRAKTCQRIIDDVENMT